MSFGNRLNFMFNSFSRVCIKRPSVLDIFRTKFNSFTEERIC